jgi:hypothetical protein
MKLPIALGTFLLLALSFLPGSSSGAEPDSGLAGTWEVPFPGRPDPLVLVLAADGAGTLDGETIRYSVRGSQLSILNDGETQQYEFKLHGNELTLTGGDLERPTTLVRKGAGKGLGSKLKAAEAKSAISPSTAPSGSGAIDRSSPAAQVDPRIVGRWKAVTGGGVVEFKSDGTGQNRRGTFRYTADNGRLVLTEGPLVLRYGIAGNQLTVLAQGDAAKFTRTDAPVEAGSKQQAGARKVVVNQKQLAADEVAVLERQFNIRILNGAYWYDQVSGAWGLQGGPTVGWLPAGLSLGGPLQPDASGGGTGVFINGRELHPMDVQGLRQITPVLPGRYWVNAQGLCGYEGSPFPILDLAALARAAQNRGGGGSTFWRNDHTGIGAGSDGRTSYVMGKDFSVIIGD